MMTCWAPHPKNDSIVTVHCPTNMLYHGADVTDDADMAVCQTDGRVLRKSRGTLVSGRRFEDACSA
jgi:hypothetical protein